MNEETMTVQEVAERKTGKRRSIRVKTLALTLVCAVFMVPSAFATTTGLAAVTAQSSTVVTWVSNVFSMLTGNEYFALLMAFGLVAVAIRMFRRAKRAAR